MALFQGEEMVDVTTPDGRTLTLPRSLVPQSMMPQQQLGAIVGGVKADKICFFQGGRTSNSA